MQPSSHWLAERFHHSVGEGFLRDLLDHVHDGLCFVDPSMTVVFWNRGAERLTGYAAAEVVGTRYGDSVLVAADPEGLALEGHESVLEDALNAGETRSARVFCRHRDGHAVPLSLRAVPIEDQDGVVAGAALSFSDDAENRHLREQVVRLSRAASTDALTGLPNRRAFDEALDLAFYRFERHGHLFGLILLDLDHFKSVNDRFGHATGDLMLQAVARTLGTVRRRDETAARWGGEEFTVLVQPVDGIPDLAAAADRIQRTIARTSIYAGKERVAVTASLGATLVRAEDDPERLIARADALLYSSKAAGRNRSSIS